MDEKQNKALQESRIGETAQKVDETESPRKVSVVTHSADASGETTAEKVYLTNKEQYHLGALLSTICNHLKVGQKFLLALAWARSLVSVCVFQCERGCETQKGSRTYILSIIMHLLILLVVH